MPLLTPVVRSRSGCWMATLDPHLLVLAWIHPSVRPVLAAVYRWRRRSHGSVGLGILLAVPLWPAAPFVSPVVIGISPTMPWGVPTSLQPIDVPWHSDLRHGGDACSACLLLSDLVAWCRCEVTALLWCGPRSAPARGWVSTHAPGLVLHVAPIFLGVLLFDPGMVLNGGRNGLDRYRSGPTWRRVCIGRVALWASPGVIPGFTSIGGAALR